MGGTRAPRGVKWETWVAPAVSEPLRPHIGSLWFLSPWTSQGSCWSPSPRGCPCVGVGPPGPRAHVGVPTWGSPQFLSRCVPMWGFGGSLSPPPCPCVGLWVVPEPLCPHGGVGMVPM